MPDTFYGRFLFDTEELRGNFEINPYFGFQYSIDRLYVTIYIAEVTMHTR